MGEQTKFPQRSVPLRIQVYEYLHDRIIEGTLKAGEMYSEQQISSTLGTSKTPVREAMLQLNQEGIIEYYPNKGIKVKEIGEDDIREIFEMLCALESFVFESLNKNDIKKIIQEAEHSLNIQKKLIDENDKVTWISASFSFHMLFVNAVGNKRITDAIERFLDDIQRMGREFISDENRMQQAFLEHERIVSTLKKGGGKAAKTAIIEHLRNTKSYLLAGRADKISKNHILATKTG